MKKRLSDIVCLGEPLLEFTEVTKDGEDPAYVRGFGGDTSNCAIAAVRQGASVGYVTAVSADDFGDAFFSLWKAEGVDTSYVIRAPDVNTGIYYVFPTPTGRNFAYFRAGSAASCMRPSDIPEGYVKGAKVLHVSGISQAISDSACDAVFRAMEIARENGVKISYDSNLRLKLWPISRARAIIHESMRLCDIAFPSFDDSRHLTGLFEADAIVDFYLELGASLVALKMGEKGAMIATPDRRVRIPPYKVEPIDATGAGDTFDGAFLAEYLEHDDPFVAGRYAAAAAALTTTGLGAVSSIPKRAAVEEMLQEQDDAG
ncbi:MAG: sugar kinase [Gammaproteobacteria bacterium]|nr:sugar kinase [Gammaproteobacteria bacterium]